ncbi:hypothetical protein T484DRAFT_1799412 [Baffinella frigidus]|nr:hypothetical protein T484DRAFT_1799412 [Cryptophyta sp. CCMP2293]
MSMSLKNEPAPEMKILRQDPSQTHQDVEFECIEVDFDACQEASACPENADCENTEGSFYCECHEGYRMTDQGCEDINECEYECNYPPGMGRVVGLCDGIGLVVKLCDWRDSSFLLFHELRLVVPVDLVSPEELFSHLMENPDGVSFVFLPTTGYDLEPAFNSSLREAIAEYVR